MQTNELAKNVAKETGIPHIKAIKIVKSVFDAMSDALANGDKVAIRGFGTFYVTQHQARTGRNPKTGENLYIPAQRVVRIKNSSVLKEALNG